MTLSEEWQWALALILWRGTQIMHGLDLMVLAMFTVECVLKIMSERLRPWKFFVSP